MNGPARVIKEARLAAFKSLMDVCRAADMAKSTLCKYENGTLPVDLRVIDRLAPALGVEPGELARKVVEARYP